MVIFNINDYPGNYVMHCKTEEEDRSFREYLHSVGRKWSSGNSYLTKTYWNVNREYTCYRFNSDEYGDIHYYRRTDYTILEWSDFMKKTFTKADLRNGDVVKKRNGEVEIVFVETGTLICKRYGFNRLSDFNDDLTYSGWSDSNDIVAVRRPTETHHCRFDAFDHEVGELVYDREAEEVEEMTLEEVCKALGKNIKIVKGA